MSDDQSADSAVASDPRAEIRVKRSGDVSDVSFPIGNVAVIGRFDPAVGPIDVDLASLPEGSYVSRKHAEIRFEDGAWRIKDLGSSNGTFLVGESGDFERIDGERPLEDGAEFALGNARFVFFSSAADSSTQVDEDADDEGDGEDGHDASASGEADVDDEE
jgi:pSer/pThr/pTyr-binding forkhead associated (FHA) protein